MTEFVFDQVWPNMQLLRQYGASSGPKAMTAHLILGNSHPAHSGQDCVLAHWAIAVTRAGKNIHIVTSERMQYRKYLHRLARQRHDQVIIHVLSPRFGSVDLREFKEPLCLVQIYI